MWAVDSYRLDGTTNGTPIRNIELREGLYSPPSAVGGNGTIANFTGERWRQKKHGPGRFVLNMWVAPPGSGGSSTVTMAALDAAIDELYRVFQHTNRLLTFQRTMNSGEVRQSYGEVITLAATPIGKGLGGYRFAIEVNVPSAYWTSATAVSNSTGANTATSRTLNLTAFQGATAPLEDLTVTIQGGCTNPYVQDTTNADLTAVNSTVTPSGDWFTYYGTIPADAALVVNCANWTIAGTGGDSVGGFNPLIGALTHSGGRFLTVSAPRPGRNSTVGFSAVNVSASCNVTVTGRKFFMV